MIVVTYIDKKDIKYLITFDSDEEYENWEKGHKSKYRIVDIKNYRGY